MFKKPNNRGIGGSEYEKLLRIKQKPRDITEVRWKLKIIWNHNF